GTFPWAFDVGKRHAAIFRQFTRVRASSRLVRADPAKQSRPALLLRAPGARELTVAAWKDLATFPAEGRNLVVRYGPGTVPLPFTVQLNDFRKQDYPGTDMAMSYESDVTAPDPSGGSKPFRIYMNNPYHGSGWKVYQSGFSMEEGEVSIFSVM